MKIHVADIGAITTYVAGGGLAAVFAFLGTVYPQHAAQFNGGATALVAIAGLLRVLTNPTPMNTATVTDKATNSDVTVSVSDSRKGS